MTMLFKAAFWIALVAYFMPGNPAADALTGSAHQSAQQVAALTEKTPVDAYGDAIRLCSENPTLCTAGVDAVANAQDLAVEGLDALATVLEERKHN